MKLTIRQRKLIEELSKSKSVASRRAAVARQLGFVRNLETRKGLPAQYVPGDPLPEETNVLPSPEALQCCTVESEETQPHSPAHVDVVVESAGDSSSANGDYKRLIEVEV